MSTASALSNWEAIIGSLSLVLIVVLAASWLIIPMIVYLIAQRKNLPTKCYFWAALVFGPWVLAVVLLMPHQPPIHRTQYGDQAPT